MIRRALKVRDNAGVYDMIPWEWSQLWRDVRKHATRIEVIEMLQGWSPWRWAVEIEYQTHPSQPPSAATYFVSGAAEPRLRGPQRFQEYAR